MANEQIPSKNENLKEFHENIRSKKSGKVRKDQGNWIGEENYGISINSSAVTDIEKNKNDDSSSSEDNLEMNDNKYPDEDIDEGAARVHLLEIK